MTDSLQPRGLQNAKIPCPSLSPAACSNSCPVSWWCHPAFSSSVVPFSCLQSFPASGSFSVSQIFASGARILELQHHPSSQYSGLISFRIDWFDLLAVQGTFKSLLQLHSSKASILWHSAFFIAQLLHPYVTTGKIIALTRWTFVSKVMSLVFNMLSRLVSRKDSESEWLARQPGINPITVKPWNCEPRGRAVLLGSLTLLLSAQMQLPNKISLSAHVSPRIVHFRVLDKSPLSCPGRGPPSCSS